MSITGIAARIDSPFAAPTLATTELAKRKEARDTAPVRKTSSDSEGYSSHPRFSSAKSRMQANRELMAELQGGIELLKFTNFVITKIEDTLIDMQALAVRLGNALTSDNERTELSERFSILAQDLSRDSLRCLQWNGIAVAGAGLKGYYITINSRGDRITLNDEVFELEWALGGALSTDRMLSANNAMGTAFRINADLTRLASFKAKTAAIIANLEMYLEAAMNSGEGEAWHTALDCTTAASRMAKMSSEQIVNSSTLAMLCQANIFGGSAMRLI